MAVRPAIANLGALRVDRNYIRGLTPPARLEYLFGVNAAIHGVATTPYASTALCCEFAKSPTWKPGFSSTNWQNATSYALGDVVTDPLATSARWICTGAGTSSGTGVADDIGCTWTATPFHRLAAQLFAPGALSGQARITRSYSVHNSDARDASLYGITTSGVTGNDEIVIPPGRDKGRDEYPLAEGRVVLSESARVEDLTPAAAGDRALELPSQLTPHLEKFKLHPAVGFCVRVFQVSDLEALV